MAMTEQRLTILKERFSDRKILEELEWCMFNIKSGYHDKASAEFLNWLCCMAYEEIKFYQDTLAEVKTELKSIDEDFKHFDDWRRKDGLSIALDLIEKRFDRTGKDDKNYGSSEK